MHFKENLPVDKSIKVNMKSKVDKGVSKKAMVFTSMSACICLSLGLYFTFVGIQPSVVDCEQRQFRAQTDENGLPLSIQCAGNGNEVSWLAWVTNKSTSNQFHFLDLLELLSQIDSDEQ
jgi:hypothetical protein